MDNFNTEKQFGIEVLAHRKALVSPKNGKREKQVSEDLDTEDIGHLADIIKRYKKIQGYYEKINIKSKFSQCYNFALYIQTTTSSSF